MKFGTKWEVTILINKKIQWTCSGISKEKNWKNVFFFDLSQEDTIKNLIFIVFFIRSECIRSWYGTQRWVCLTRTWPQLKNIKSRNFREFSGQVPVQIYLRSLIFTSNIMTYIQSYWSINPFILKAVKKGGIGLKQYRE